MFSLIIKLVKELLFFFVMAAGIWLYSDDPAPAGELKIPARPASSAGIYVKDEAEVLSAPAEQYLQSLGRQLDQKTTAQLVVVTVKSLNGAPLEDYSLQILRTWGIGSKEKNNGVLLLISTGDRKSRVEVGYGLEGALTDSITGQIQDQFMIPYFKENKYEEGIIRGYEELARRIGREYNVQLASTGYANHSPGQSGVGAGGESTDELFNQALREQNGTVAGSDQKSQTGFDTNGNGTEAGERKPDSVTGVSPAQPAVAPSVTGKTEGTEPAVPPEEKGIWDTVVDFFGVDSWILIAVIIAVLDFFLLDGALCSIVLQLLSWGLFSGGGGSGGGGGSSGGSYGGGSGGGGGSSRSW